MYARAVRQKRPRLSDLRRAAQSALLALLVAGGACGGGATEAQSDDPALAYLGEHLLYHGRLFTGVLTTHIAAADVVRRTPYHNGLIDGVEEELYANGSLAARREYRAGKKVGVHRGWFPDGQRSYRYEYKNNQFHGDYWEWHASGALYSYARYDEGRPVGRKVWREDGTIYMNYVFADGAAYGMPGAKLCRQVRADESGRTTSL